MLVIDSLCGVFSEEEEEDDKEERRAGGEKEDIYLDGWMGG